MSPLRQFDRLVLSPAKCGSLGLTPDQSEAFLSGNARRVFKL